MTTKSDILGLIEQLGALKDSELARLLGVAHQQVNQAARSLAAAGAIRRVAGPDGVIRNHLESAYVPPPRFQEEVERGGAFPFARAWPTIGRVVADTPVPSDDLARLGLRNTRLNGSPTRTSLRAA